jgi:hypothetical protein
MQCQIRTLEKLTRQNTLIIALAGTLSKDSTLTVPDPEDLKGLREWVTAKRICEITPEEKNRQIYSAPWRVG